MTDRKTRARRLEAAGYVYVSGWLPAKVAADVILDCALYAAEAERIASEPMERGRPSNVVKIRKVKE